MMHRFLYALLITLTASLPAGAQDQPIGMWRSHLPYNSAVGLATDGSVLYVATELGFFTYNTRTGELTPYSKVDGMADVGMSGIGYDAATGTAILAYANSNIDLFAEGSFYNIPDLYLKVVTGSKAINHIYTEDGLAYLSTGIGIIVLNLDRREVKETYSFIRNSQTIAATAFTGLGNYWYATTPEGLYRASKGSANLQAFSSWQQLGGRHQLSTVARLGNQLFAAGPDSLFVLSADTLRFLAATGNATRRIDAGQDRLWVSTFDSAGIGWVYALDPQTYQFTDSLRSGLPRQALSMPGGYTWVANQYAGPERHSSGEQPFVPLPQGPGFYTSFDILPRDKNLWVAHGGHSETFVPQNQRWGFSRFEGERWRNYSVYTEPFFGDSLYDYTVLAIDPNTQALYAGSMQRGLLILKPDGSKEALNRGSVLESKRGEPGIIPVSGLAFDLGGNLWINQMGAQHPLAVRTPQGNWRHFTILTPYGNPYAGAAYGVLVDDYNQKWFFAPQGGGVIVYDDQQTPENPNDDRQRQLWVGKGNGNLPSTVIFCLAKDRNGAIWIGSNNGIGIVSCPGQVISGQCESELRVVQYDQFAGNLFTNEQVKSIAVDGANRKWIGTNNGIWLLSPEGDRIIYRFTTANSPLPSNRIQKIAIDPISGDVYFGTDLGLVSFRSTATAGGPEHEAELLCFPNPVPADYNGTIAIRGLAEDADVRITDIAGQLVFRTKALGGQAVWNGLDYTGRRPQSGVYLIFATNKDGSQTTTGKLMLQR